MGDANFIENIATVLGQNASVKTVYGDPIVTNGKTITPVAQVTVGFGGGFGEKKKKSLSSGNPQGESGENEKGINGEGAGGGGGMYVRAKGVYEITGEQTRFIPLNNNKRFLLAALLGFLIRGFLIGKKRS